MEAETRTKGIVVGSRKGSFVLVGALPLQEEPSSSLASALAFLQRKEMFDSSLLLLKGLAKETRPEPLSFRLGKESVCITPCLQLLSAG